MKILLKRKVLIFGIGVMGFAVYALVKSQSPPSIEASPGHHSPESSKISAPTEMASDDLNLNYETISYEKAAHSPSISKTAGEGTSRPQPR